MLKPVSLDTDPPPESPSLTSSHYCPPSLKFGPRVRSGYLGLRTLVRWYGSVFLRVWPPAVVSMCITLFLKLDEKHRWLGEYFVLNMAYGKDAYQVQDQPGVTGRERVTS